MALHTCAECSGKVSDWASSCPHCGSPVEASAEPKPKRKGRFFRFIGNALLVLFGIGVVVNLLGRDEENALSAGAASSPEGQSAVLAAVAEGDGSASPALGDPDALLALAPQAQIAMIRAVEQGRTAYRGASNDLAASKVRRDRAVLICGDVPSSASEWVGYLTGLTTNSDGKAIIEVEIAKDITVATWNNSFSDIIDNTLVPQSDPVFADATALSVGAAVHFNGQFVHEDLDCYGTQELTERGAMRDPTYTFRFSAIKALPDFESRRRGF